TISWSRALDGFWYGRADARIQQVTANLFAAFLNGAPGVRGLALSAPAAATAGTPFTVTVTAVDGQGAPVTSYNGTVHFTSSDTAAAARLPPDSMLTGGQGTFNVTLTTAGAQTVTASDVASSLPSATASLAVGARAADHLALATSASPASGSSFPFTVI